MTYENGSKAGGTAPRALGTRPALLVRMDFGLGERLAAAELAYQAAQARHDGSEAARARYCAALRELTDASSAVSQALRRRVESTCPSAPVAINESALLGGRAGSDGELPLRDGTQGAVVEWPVG